MSKRILYLGLDPTGYMSQEKGRESEVIHWPIIEVVPRALSESAVHQALSNFFLYTHVILTSKSTVAILGDYLTRLGIDKDVWNKKLNFAVGKATAAHLHTCGITSVIVAEEERAEGIIQLFDQISLKEAHLFYPHSAIARPVIEEYLNERSVLHTSCLLYDTKTRSKGPMPDLSHFDEIIFTSPSTVDAFMQIFGELPAYAELTAIGPITAGKLKLYRT